MGYTWDTMGYLRCVFAGQGRFSGRDTPSGRLRGSEYERVEGNDVAKVFKDGVTGRGAPGQFQKYISDADRLLGRAEKMLRYQSAQERELLAARHAISRVAMAVEEALEE